MTGSIWNCETVIDGACLLRFGSAWHRNEFMLNCQFGDRDLLPIYVVQVLVINVVPNIFLPGYVIRWNLYWPRTYCRVQVKSWKLLSFHFLNCRCFSGSESHTNSAFNCAGIILSVLCRYPLAYQYAVCWHDNCCPSIRANSLLATYLQFCQWLIPVALQPPGWA